MMSDFKVNTQVTVRFADVDSMGHVNNAKFFTYMEQGRVAYFKHFPELDFTRDGSASGTSLILAEIQCRFLSPAYLEETLNVALGVTQMKRSSFVMQYEIIETKSGRAIATGQSVQVYYDYSAKKSVEIPDTLRKKFEAIEGKTFRLPVDNL